jgi:hypothetical protein
MKVSGVALQEHTESVGKSGIEKRWPAEELQKAATTLSGCPVHSEASTSADTVVGSVIDAHYEEGVGVMYEAVIEDEELGEKIKTGTAELAPRLTHDSHDADPDEPVTVKDIEFRTLFATPEATESVPGHLMVDGLLQP